MRPLLVVNPFQERQHVHQHICERIELQQAVAIVVKPTKKISILALSAAMLEN
jgi:hypothetical protein